eukprot:TRINITY_DN27929_c0_g1_i1.p2 TRINITY_DN27929_c0_g1~~TRINITY_DN27929_c0_g1_i1.p2  ORF type:complete len:188 (-),score=31.51 TRINITY_DN27929_c0_g1_i1:194-757(-)
MKFGFCIVSIWASFRLAASVREQTFMDTVENPCEACSPQEPFWNRTAKVCTEEPDVPNMELWDRWIQAPHNSDAVAQKLDAPISLFTREGEEYMQRVPTVRSAFDKVSLERCAAICALSEVCIAWMYGPGRIRNKIRITGSSGYTCALFASDPKDVMSGGALRIAMKNETGSQKQDLSKVDACKVLG